MKAFHYLVHVYTTHCSRVKLAMGLLRKRMKGRTLPVALFAVQLALWMFANLLPAAAHTNMQPAVKIIVTNDSQLDGSSLLVYKLVRDTAEDIVVIDVALGTQSRFRVPPMARSPVLMKHGICVPCSDGDIMLFSSSGSKKYTKKLMNTTILENVRISEDKMAVVGAWWSEKLKAFELSLKVVHVTADRITVKDFGSVPRVGRLISTDGCTVWWIRDDQAKRFAVCE